MDRFIVRKGRFMGEPLPGSGITERTIGQTTIGDTDYVLRETTFAPGASTGWHTHPGDLYSYVHSGALTHDVADHTEVFHPGQMFTDHADEVHIGRNLGATPTVLIGFGVLPHGVPFGEDSPAPH